MFSLVAATWLVPAQFHTGALVMYSLVAATWLGPAHFHTGSQCEEASPPPALLSKDSLNLRTLFLTYAKIYAWTNSKV